MESRRYIKRQKNLLPSVSNSILKEVIKNKIKLPFRFSVKHKRKLLVLFVFFTILALGIVMAHLFNSTVYVSGPSSSPIYAAGVEIYGGNLTEGRIDWGSLSLGEKKSVSFFLRSSCSDPIKIVLETSNWTPSKLVNYLFLSWNYDDAPILPNEQILVVLHLELLLSEDALKLVNTEHISSFSFDISISSTVP